jgi:dolichol-phosphate mannosyltransferase
MKNLCFIVPVYNEEKNVQTIFYKLKKLKISFDILFVEDNSVDKTRNEIIFLNKKFRNVFYIFRKKKSGVGSAHKVGIKWCYKKKYQKVITMDADGTHDTKYIRKLLKYSNNYHMIITSRFKDKNSLSDWPLNRKILTYTRLILCKIFLGMNLDASGAFRCFYTKKISLQHLIGANSNHYDYFFESIYILLCNNYSIYELPIRMPIRKLGKSKMNLLHILFAIVTLLKIKFIYKKIN